MKRMTSLLLPLLIAPILLLAQTTIKGTVTAPDGTLLPLAHVHLFPFKGEIGMDPISTTEVGKDGRFSLAVATPGLFRLIATGVNHDHISAPVSIEEGMTSVTIDIRPQGLAYDRAPEEVMVIGDWNDFDFQSAEPMKREKDGTFTYTLESGSRDVHYQLIGIARTVDGEMRSVNAPGSEAYVYDGGGDYRSVLKVKPGKLTIRFNPKDLPAATGDNEAQVRYDDPAQTKLWDIELLYTRRMQRFRQAAIAAQESGEAPDIVGIWTPFKEEMKVLMGEGNDPPVRRFAALYMARLLKYNYNPKYMMLDDDDLATIRALLPPDSPIWGADPALATVTAMTGAENPNEAIMEVVESSPDRTVRAVALSQIAMNEHFAGNREQALKHYTTLKAEYGDVEEVEYVLSQLNPDKAIQNGKEVPEFEVALVGDAGGTDRVNVSKESMKGKYYLIDFWATWCGPCVGEMGSLHSAYEKFGGDRFEILSISFDAKVDDIAEFREAKWKMPWLHAFAQGGFRSGLAQTFEVSGIPKPVLVDPNGRIVATEGELRGPKLEKTLETYLGDGQAAR